MSPCSWCALFAFTSLVQKAVSGVGVFAAGQIIVLINFPKGANPADVPEAVTNKLALVYMPVLALFYGIGLVIMQAVLIASAFNVRKVRRTVLAPAH